MVNASPLVGTTTTPKPAGMPPIPGVSTPTSPVSTWNHSVPKDPLTPIAKPISPQIRYQTVPPSPPPVPNGSGGGPKFPDLSKGPRPTNEGSPPRHSKKKLSLKLIVGTILLCIVVVASGAGLYLSQTNQDLRNQAAINCGSITCNDGRTTGPECNASQKTCQDRANEFCGPSGVANMGDPGSCLPDGVGSCESSDCRGSCDNSPSCEYSGDCNLCSEIDGSKGKESIFCRGYSTDSCNKNMASFLPELSNNSGSIGTMSEEKWCTTAQLRSWGPAGTDIRIVYIGKNGQICIQGTGCDPESLNWSCSSNNPQNTAGTFSAACYPQTGQKLGDLRYRLSITDTQPENFGTAVFFVSFSGSNNIPALTDEYLGKPTWASKNGQPHWDPTDPTLPTCVGADWCGFWLKQVDDPDPNTADRSVTWDWAGPHRLAYRAGGIGYGPTINELATKIEELKAAGTLPANYKIPVDLEYRLPDGTKYTDFGIKQLDITPYACGAPQSLSKTWTVTTQLLCPDGTTPTNIKKRMFWTVWPPEPLVWNYNPRLSAEGSTGTITQTITVDNILPTTIKNVYVGLTAAAYGAEWDGRTYTAINPPTDIIAGMYFNPPSSMFKLDVKKVATGNVALSFETTAEDCASVSSPAPSPTIGPAPTPTPTPATTPKPTPSPSPSPAPGNAACLWKRAYTSYYGDTSASRILTTTTVNPGDEFYFRTRIIANTDNPINDSLINDSLINDSPIDRVTFIDRLPKGLTYIADEHNTPGLVYDSATRTVSLTYSTLTSFEIVDFKVKVDQDVSTNTTITNTASVTNVGIQTSTPTSDCSVDVLITEVPPEPVFECNSSCTTDQQCQTANGEFICSAVHGNICRLDSNRDSQTCAPLNFACNSVCETDAQCQTANSNYICHVEEHVCRLASHPDVSNCTNPTALPPLPTVGCNEVCSTNTDCSNTSHICYTTPENTNLCRLANYPNSTTCTQPSESIVVQPDLPQALPVTGPADWLDWIKTGLLTLGVGALLLLLL
ncbi:MAG: isopeptide-forming domain-containing fimbrial protein [Pseudomonadales bacterium]|nr:isopeptide-forming domain-containing fimbrial protein [Pseudomonadales bacterium]